MKVFQAEVTPTGGSAVEEPDQQKTKAESAATVQGAGASATPSANGRNHDAPDRPKVLRAGDSYRVQGEYRLRILQYTARSV